MNDWIHSLPLGWMAVTIFGLTFVVGAGIHVAVTRAASGARLRAFKAVSPGMLPPLGILFGLFIGFTGAQVWSDNDRAAAAVYREASALRTATLLSVGLPADMASQLRASIRRHIEEVTSAEWPDMANGTATLTPTSASLAQALQMMLSLRAEGSGQQSAQSGIITALEAALEARRERLLISHARVGDLKWLGIILQGLCALFAIALVHSDNRLAAALTIGLFSIGIAVSVFTIIAYDRPFTGNLAVSPGPLLQIMPAAETRSGT
jgi:hypothetical protein